MVNLQKAKLSLKKNDQVQVMAGREKGKTGKVLKVDSKNQRIVIEGLNLMKRHTKPTRTTSGGISEKEASMSYSNVLLFCQKCNRGVRHGQKLLAEGKKVRVCKRCDESLDPA